MKILDCTLRDGGHLNNWSFDKKFASDLYKCACKSNISYFEVGYRNSTDLANLGDFAYSSDKLLQELFLESSGSECKLAVMAQHGKFKLDDFKPKDSTNTLLTAIRVATYPDTIPESFNECKILKDYGYEVFMNVMAISRYNDEMFATLGKIKNKDKLDCLVFSDSFGALLPNQVANITQKLLDIGFCKLGFHPHNNQQLAFANSIVALESGCEVIDASMTGLGRGAGNLPIELLLGYLAKENSFYNPNFYFELATKYYPEKLPFILNLICGLTNIHHNYTEALYQKYGFDINNIVRQAQEISSNSQIKFDSKYL